MNQRLAACATGLDVARECAAQTKGGAPLSGVNVATALQRIAKLEARRVKRDDRVDKAFHVLAKEAARQAQDGAPRELANILWALAKFKLTEAAVPEVFDALSQACAAKAPAFNAQDVSNTAWAWATAGVSTNQAGWDALAAHAPSKIESFDQRALSLTAWAFATSGVAAPPLFEAIAQAAPARMARDEFDAQGYANTAPGGVLSPRSPARRRFDRHRRDAPPAQAWASPRPATRPARPAALAESPLFDAIAEYAPPHMDEFKPQEPSATAWACGKHGCSLRLYDSIAAAAPRRIAEFSPQGLAYDRCDPANRPFHKTHNITQDFGGVRLTDSRAHRRTRPSRDGRRPGARALRVDRRGRAAHHLPVQSPVAGDAGVELRSSSGRRASTCTRPSRRRRDSKLNTRASRPRERGLGLRHGQARRSEALRRHCINGGAPGRGLRAARPREFVLGVRDGRRARASFRGRLEVAGSYAVEVRGVQAAEPGFVGVVLLEGRGARPGLFAEIAAAAMNNIDAFAARHLAKTAWAFSVAEEVEARALSRRSRRPPEIRWTRSSRGLRERGPLLRQGGRRGTRAFEAMAPPLTPAKLDAFTPRTSRTRAGPTPRRATQNRIVRCHGRGRGAARRRVLAVQGLANTAWGFATAGVAPALFDAIKGQVVADAATFDAQASATWPGPWRRRASLSGEAFEAVAAASTGASPSSSRRRFRTCAGASPRRT